MSEYRTCQTCGQIKTLDQYGYQNRTENKHKYICQPCDKARQKAYYYKNRKELLQKKQAYYFDNRAILLAKTYVYRKNNKDKIRESFAKWLTKNPEGQRNTAKRRKARLRGAEIKKVTAKDIQKLLSFPCFYCGKKDNLQIDHVIPVSRGGRHAIGNLVAACASCNASKNKWFITEWKMLKGKNVVR